MNVIDRALELLEDGDRWYKDEYEGRMPNGRTGYCLLGAILHVDHTNARRNLCETVIKDVIREQYGECSIPHFNDFLAESFDDVRVVLEKAARKLDEMEM